jgi:hypothetical protein
MVCTLALGAGALVMHASAAAGQSAKERRLAELLEEFSELPGLSAKFREEKNLDLLAVPVQSEGVLHFDPPGRLLRRVEKPRESVALIRGDRLIFKSENEKQEIDLADNPVVAGFVQSFRDVLAGDRQALEKTYRVAFESAEQGGWKLTLEPRKEPLTRFLKKMVLEGKEAEVETMKMVQANGDERTTEFYDVRVHDWDEDRASKVFRIE